MKILETERLLLRQMDSANDAEFIFALLNSPKFIEYIGDRGVRSVDEAAVFIEDRYRASYLEHGFGLYVVELKGGIADEDTVLNSRVSAPTQIGICGFVKRDHLEFPDIGFAFLPEFEAKGYGFESASAVLNYGRETLGFSHVLAITSIHNDVSVRLLNRLGFVFDGLIESPDNEKLKLFLLRFI